ncbi:FKBP-type peptidyl-prolyl cis-trans isomerase [Thermococcus gammatolerans]|uniref:Peptidyl-prolyl cis-trans isomerase n=1 Tax=Thermococcus gammatolerans (strain DSM 15229 / JCM 11827 / EJ3) TaxID=593117 RepID=C5A738_THEGJ|nr:peptidylprolyl isomerase [Thermococcus gammatolerans]ACS34050.1 FKBP-type peptidyl-prolyl cis-trans isomerase (slyD) [Thermococcus gammatolerans EJ3]
MVKVEKGDVIRLRYTGRIKETGEIFDTTDEEIAKQAGIYKESGVYGPVPIAVGAGHVIKGLDEQLEGLEVGKKYEIIVPPEKGFGKRDPKLIKVFTLGQFRRQGIIPFPGMPIEIESEGGRKIKGRVLTVSGGRVRVDFNHPYAGKHLIYEVEIVEKVEDPIEKVKAMIELRLPRIDTNKVVIEVGEKDVTINFTPVLEEIDKNTLVLGEILLESDLKFIGYEDVTFKPNVEELLKPPEEAAEENVEEKVEEQEETEEAGPAETVQEEKTESDETGEVKEETENKAEPTEEIVEETKAEEATSPEDDEKTGQ